MSRDHARPDGVSPPDLRPPVRAPSHAERCRTLIATARSATLATLARDPAGYPYASLVTVAFDEEGCPLFLLSTLAEHTANLVADARASALVAEPMDDARDPLAIGRMTLLGACRRVAADDPSHAAVKAAFLAAQPSASYYVDFRDFGFFRLDVESIRYVGGFGRMSWVAGTDYRKAEADPLAASADGILSHMNTDHAEAVVAYARHLAFIEDAASATMTAVDRYGFELTAATAAGPRAGRVAFAEECTTPDAVRREVVTMLKGIRAAARGESTDA